jgi:hypothetical protein
LVGSWWQVPFSLSYDISGFPFRRNCSSAKEWLKREQRIGAIIALHSLRIRPGIPSGPVALDVSRWYRCLATSSSETVVSDSWEEEIKKEMESSGFMVVSRTEDGTEIGVK